MTIEANLLQVKQSIASLSKDVTLVVVSKFHGVDKIIEAVKAGQKVFAENRVQESYAKWPTIKSQYPDIELHLIGALQSNKVAEAVKLFDVIESVDRHKLADLLIKEMRKQQKFIPCLIQINIGKELQKAGVMPEEADDFIKYSVDKGLNIIGLMCIPPENENPEPYFRQMKVLSERHNLKVLSMGMSTDFESAIKCGATQVRVGTAIFGRRVL